MNNEITADHNKHEYIAGSRKWLKHVRCEGAHFHVISYYKSKNGAVKHCSEHNCVVNWRGADEGYYLR